MLKFFRRIRRKILTEGNLKKYLVYATGEILLVVIGILIALQINNWNETQKKHETIKVYLENYIKDLNDDKKRMERLITLNSFKYHALQYLLKMAGEDLYIPDLDIGFEPSDTIVLNNMFWKGPVPREYDKTFIQVAFVYSHRKQNHTLNLSTINELKSVGLYSYLNNQKLKESINFYYSEWDWRIGEDNEKVERELIEKWQDSWEEDGLITSNILIVDDPLRLLKSHPKRVYLMKRLIREAGWLTQSASIIARNADDLIAGVQEEIDSYAN